MSLHNILFLNCSGQRLFKKKNPLFSGKQLQKPCTAIFASKSKNHICGWTEKISCHYCILNVLLICSFILFKLEFLMQEKLQQMQYYQKEHWEHFLLIIWPKLSTKLNKAMYWTCLRHLLVGIFVSYSSNSLYSPT